MSAIDLVTTEFKENFAIWGYGPIRLVLLVLYRNY